METPSESESPNPRTAKEYYRDHHGRVMVLCGKDGSAPESRHFFTLASVSTLDDGLLVTGIFENNRREHIRVEQVRLATEWEIASRNG